jgi:hypothetical protein
MLNCNLRVFYGGDNSKSRTEAGKLARALRNREARWEKSVTDALIENKGIGCRSVGGLVLREELIQFTGEGRGVRTPPPFRSDRESIHVSHNKFPNHFN